MPVVIPYTAGLSSISSSLGDGIMLETKPGEFVRGNTYILTIVNSGLGKSRSSSPMLAPLYSIHDQLQEEWKEAYLEKKADLDEIEVEIEANKKALKGRDLTDEGRQQAKKKLSELYDQKGKIEGDKMPELYTGHTTEPALAILLRDNNEVVSGIAAEAGGAIQILAGKYSSANKGEVKTEDGLLLSAYCQERHKGNRATTQSIELRAPTVNLYWMFQSRYVPMLFGNHSLSTGGFLARCLAFNSNAAPKELDGNEPDISQELRNQFNKVISGLFYEFRLKGGSKIVRPAGAAREAMRQYYNECIRLANGDLLDVQQFPLRWCENAWKIALNLHAAAFREESPNHELRGDTAEKAIKIARWFSVEFLSLMSGGREDQLEEDARRLFEYVSRRGEVFAPGQKKSMTVREIGRNRTMKAEEIRKIVKSNPQFLRIDSVTPERGGTPSERVFAGGR